MRLRWFRCAVVIFFFVLPVEAQAPSPADNLARLKAGQNFRGKGMWIWNWNRCHKGDPQAIVNKTRWAGLSFVVVKTADGQKTFGPQGAGDDCIVSNDLVALFHSQGIAVHAWGYFYGNHPEKEAERTIDVLHNCKADGFVFDVESEYANRSAAAEKLCSLVRFHLENCESCKKKVLAYAPFPQVAKHQNFPYAVFSKYCDYVMPQMYWYWGEGRPGRSPEYIVWQTYSQWLSWEDQMRREGKGNLIKPLIPIAQTTYDVDPQEIFDFMGRVRGYFGISFWSWEHASDGHWQVIKNGPISLKPQVIARLPTGHEGVPEPMPPARISFWERVWMFQPFFAPWRWGWWKDVGNQLISSVYYGVICGVIGILFGIFRLILGVIASIITGFLFTSHLVWLVKWLIYGVRYGINWRWQRRRLEKPTYTSRDWLVRIWSD